MKRLTGFQRAGLALLLALLVLTALGGIVRVTGSGLACPDWPGCYGAVIPTGDFGQFAPHQVWLEWSHRLLAAVIGLLVLAYAVYALRRQPRAVWLPAILAIPMLALQVILGGLTVTERLEALIVTLHLAAAMLIVMLIAVSWLSAFNWPAVADRETDAPLGLSPPDQARTFARIALLAALLVYAAVVVGSYVTHIGADPDLAANVGPGGAACGNNWPFCYGGLWPEGSYAQWHMSHRLLVVVAGLTLLGAALGAVMLRPRSRAQTMLVHIAATLFVAQIAVGATMIWINFDAWARALHLSLGSLTWTLTAAAALVSAYRAGWVRASAQPRPAGAHPPTGASAPTESESDA